MTVNLPLRVGKLIFDKKASNLILALLEKPFTGGQIDELCKDVWERPQHMTQGPIDIPDDLVMRFAVIQEMLEFEDAREKLREYLIKGK